MKNKLFLVILLFLPFFPCQGESETHYTFSHLSLEDGLSQITVLCSYQDTQGFLWFGTRYGLNCFNGYNFKVFLNEPGNDSSISDNHISCMIEDNRQNLWIGTNNGLNKLDLSTNTFKRYFRNPDDKSSISHNTIYSLYIDDENGLWIGTGNGLNKYDPATDTFLCFNPEELFTNNSLNAITGKDNLIITGTNYQGLIFFDPSSGKYTRYKNDPGDSYSISHNNIKAIHKDREGNLWLGTEGGGLNFLSEGNRFIHYDTGNGLINNYVRCINETPEGDIIVGTFNGLDIINRQAKSITHYNSYNDKQGNLSHFSIYSILFDRSGTLWIGTYAGGINYYNAYATRFQFYDLPNKEKNVSGVIGSILEYENFLFFAAEGGGLLEYNTGTKTFKQYFLTDNTELSFRKNILKTLYLDGNTILCGTNLGTIYSFNPATKKFSLKYQFKSEDPVYTILRDSSGNLIAGSVSSVGLTCISPDGTMRDHFPVKGKKNVEFSNVRCVLEIRKNVFLIGTRTDGLYRYDANNEILIHYTHKPGKGNPDALPENYITSILRDKKGNIWIGTFGGGFCLFDISNGTFTSFNTEHNLLNNNVCSMVESEDGHLWISTLAGISDFNPDDSNFKNYTHSNGINVIEFTPHSGILTSRKQIFFGGNSGMVSFDPYNLSPNPYIPPIVLEDLSVNNVRIFPGGSDKILNKNINREEEITLKHNQSNISIQYCALNFIFSNHNHYAYKLDNFDKEWNDVGNRRIAYYTNIPAGKYLFRVKCANSDGIWNETEATLTINVLPPLWRTWWAYLSYLILFILTMIMILRYYNEKKQLKNEVRLKQMEVKTQEEFHEVRNNLFTNFSHELRTPITLIISPLEDIIEREQLEPGIKDRLSLMKNNARRLLRLVNNLMDFQKKESGSMKLQASQGDIIEFEEEICLLFNELAMSRNIRFNFMRSEIPLLCWYDKNLMEKVFFNFLSNAFKNTPDGGDINVRINALTFNQIKKQFPEKSGQLQNEENDFLLIEIEDSGVGIPVEELEKIFMPFYQVAQNEHSASGTGLGLSLSKSIIEMHHGIVWAESPLGKGAIFRCILPAGKTQLREDEIVEDFKDSKYPGLYDIDIPVEQIIENTHKKNANTLLVVENDSDIRYYIVSLLIKTCNIIEASNGVEALEKAIRYLPDLIISDLMMPKMDGMEMCSRLKNDLRTSHIPIIMITARTSALDIREGYEKGVDDYITKPFNSTILISRVKNILDTREKLKNLYGKRFSLETLGLEVRSYDEKFTQKLYELMGKNIDNSELNLDSFCREIGMSRANLYRKIKSITGLSPNEFIRNFRLETAAKIMSEASVNVSEVYVKVGFNSLAYFSNCFKSLYGISPTEFMNRKKTE